MPSPGSGIVALFVSLSISISLSSVASLGFLVWWFLRGQRMRYLVMKGLLYSIAQKSSHKARLYSNHGETKC